MNNQLSFPEISGTQDALTQLSAVEQEAEAIANHYQTTLAKMHAVGDFLIAKKAEISNVNFTTFLDANFEGYELEYLRKLMKFARENARSDIEDMTLKGCGREFQALLAIPEERQAAGPRPMANPATAASNMQRLLNSYKSRYGGVGQMPDIERRQIKTVFEPIMRDLAPLFTADELRGIADGLDS